MVSYRLTILRPFTDVQLYTSGMASIYKRFIVYLQKGGYSLTVYTYDMATVHSPSIVYPQI